MLFFNLKEGIIDRLKELGETDDKLMVFERDFEALQNPFKHFPSDFKIIKRFKNKGTLIMPEQIVIGEREQYKNTVGG